jgi:hypothetical protein
LGAWHYASVLDSGEFDAEYDFTLVPVNNAEINGFEITTSSWYFRLQTQPRQGQQPDIGSFGFGGRQGEHWLYQRVTNMGYAHRPTESAQNLIVVNYDPANITVSNTTRTLGPLNQTHVQSATITWSDVLQFPNGGTGWIVWKCAAVGIVEKIHIDQLGRDWIAANPQDGAWADADTYLGFIADVDYTDIPRRLIRGQTQNSNANFWDDGDDVFLENASQQLLGVLPSTGAFVEGRGGTAPIVRRFHRQGNQQRIVFGITMADYGNLLPGELVFDPPVNETIQAEGDDGYSDGIGNWQDQSGGGRVYIGDYPGGNSIYQPLDASFRFLTVTGPASGDTISASSMTVDRAGSGNGTVQILAVCDTGSTRQDALSSTHNSEDTWTDSTTAATTLVGGAAGGATKTTSGDISAAIQSVIDLAGWASGDNLCIALRENASGDDNFIGIDSGGDADPAQLDFTYTAAGGGGGPNLLTLLGVG